MPKQLFSNNAISTTVGALDVSDTVVTVASGDGSKFPSITGTDFFIITLFDVALGTLEICKCTSISGDALTIVRGQESTTPATFADGVSIEMRPTAATFENFDQVTDGARRWELEGELVVSSSFNLELFPKNRRARAFDDIFIKTRSGLVLLDLTIEGTSVTGFPQVVTTTPISIAPSDTVPVGAVLAINGSSPSGLTGVMFSLFGSFV